MSPRQPLGTNDTLGELTPRQTSALAQLLSGVGVEQAAAVAGTSERTLWRWLRESGPFRMELRARQREAMDAATRKLQATSSEAIDALKRVITDPSASHAAVVSAAKVVLDSGYRGVEIADLVARVEDLEQRLAQRSSGGQT